MRCLSCGATIKPGSRKCEICGAERFISSPEFLKLEQKYAELREEFQSGKLDYASFQSACENLVRMDEAGNRWKLNADDQNWYVERNQEWVLAYPEKRGEAQPDVMQKQAAPPQSQQKAKLLKKPASERDKCPKTWLYVAGCALVVGIGILAALAAGGLLYFSKSTDLLPIGQEDLGMEATATRMPVSATPIVLFTGAEGGFGQLFKPASSEAYDLTIDSSMYEFDIRKPEIFLTSISKKRFENFAVDVTVEDLGTSDKVSIAGFILRASEASGVGGILFEINSAGEWRVEQKDETGERQPLTDWQSTDALNPGHSANRLGVVVDGANIVFIANGVELYTLNDAAESGNYWGLIGATSSQSTSAKILYQDLRVEEIFEIPVDERPNVIARLGKPDSFYILFEENADGTVTRYEEWAYIDQQTILTFMDGVMMGSDTMDYGEGLVVAPYWYDPFQFDEKSTLADVKIIAGKDLEKMDVISEFGENVELYAGDQILVGFANGVLEYVETFAIESPAEGSAE